MLLCVLVLTTQLVGFLRSLPVRHGAPRQLFDHNFIKFDEPMGCVDVDIQSISRDTPTFMRCALDGVQSGEIEIEIRRAVVSSRPLRDILRSLSNTHGPVTDALLRQHQVTLANFMGDLPFLYPTKAQAPPINVALHTLLTYLSASKIRLQSARTAAKVARILKSQNAVATLDPPSRFLFITNAGPGWTPPNVGVNVSAGDEV
jgi:hypothetical protein